MKKKLTSLVLGVFMCIFSVFTLVGCSLVKTDDNKTNAEVVLTIGDTKLTKSEILSSFYSYYQSNSSYFAYYDEATIEESFYTWAIIKAMIDKKSAEALANGVTTYTTTDEDDVWKSTFEYVYSQVNSREKVLYPDDAENEDLPVWLREAEEEKDAAKFATYISSESVKEEKGEETIKAGDSLIKNKVAELKSYLFEYVSETDENGNETRKEIETEYEEKRNQAYAKYIQSLLESAKSNKKSTKIDDLLFNEVKRVYEAYYKSKLTELFQAYYLDDYLMNTDTLTLTDKVIAQAFLDQYNTDKEKYQSENNYISKVTSTDGASLLLYNHNGNNYYFTVQHILLKNDAAVTEKIGAIEGSSGYEKLDAVIGDKIKAEIESTVYDYFMTATVNKDALKDSIVIDDGSNKFADYYIYDEARKDNETNGYIKVFKMVENKGLENEKTFYFEDKNSNSTDANPQFEEAVDVVVDENDVLYLSYIIGDGTKITTNQILECYKFNYERWVDLADDYYALYDAYVTASDADKEAKKEAVSTFADSHKDLAYVFETIEVLYADCKSAGNKTAIYGKIADYLFVELQWIFSADSLGNALSNKMGYVISNYPDQNGSWVYEFPKGSRELVEEILTEQAVTEIEEGITKIIESGKVEDLTTTIISTYGYHIIKIGDIFESGNSMIDLDALVQNLTNKEISANNAEFVTALIQTLSKTYVCGASNQTLFDYFFDKIYTGLVGSSWVNPNSESASTSVSGTYFLALEYKWLSEYENEGKLNFVNKIGYDELMESVK